MNMGGRGVMVMDTVIRVQILDEIDCISKSTNNLEEAMNRLIRPLNMCK